MHKEQSLLELFTNQASTIPLSGFLLNFILTALLAALLHQFYIRFGNSMSNRELFGKNFVLLSLTTMLVITLVKSSLALSLGLVGALSIIRFRAAIKEPEELSYLFLAISLGLGFGAQQGPITMVAFLVILLILSAKALIRRKASPGNFYLTIGCEGAGPKLSLPEILEALKKDCSDVAMKRWDQTPDLLEASFHVQVGDVSALDGLSARLRGLNSAVRISFLDERGLGGG